jgi:hypothetical protein
MSQNSPQVVLPQRIEAVVFDLGETLADETRAWSLLAEAAGLRAFTLFATVGALIARGEDHRKVWGLPATAQPPLSRPIEARDFHPDALACLPGSRERATGSE